MPSEVFDASKEGCFYCGSPTHAMAIEVGPDGLCWDSIRSHLAMTKFTARVTAYWKWVYGERPFSRLLEVGR